VDLAFASCYLLVEFGVVFELVADPETGDLGLGEDVEFGLVEVGAVGVEDGVTLDQAPAEDVTRRCSPTTSSHTSLVPVGRAVYQCTKRGDYVKSWWAVCTLQRQGVFWAARVVLTTKRRKRLVGDRRPSTDEATSTPLTDTAVVWPSTARSPMLWGGALFSLADPWSRTLEARLDPQPSNTSPFRQMTTSLERPDPETLIVMSNDGLRGYAAGLLHFL
jgi:hypothetical protein